MTLGFYQFFDQKKTQPTNFREKILAGAGKEVVDFTIEGRSIIQNKSNDRFTGSFTFNEQGIIRDDLKLVTYTPKLHTFRLDQYDRWKAGMNIQMVYRGPKYSILDHFNKGIPELEKCKSTQKVEIKWYTFHTKDLPIMRGDEKSLTPKPKDYLTTRSPVVIIDGITFSSGCTQIKQLAINDGFDSLESFYGYFNKDFSGKIIHWTDLRY